MPQPVHSQHVRMHTRRYPFAWLAWVCVTLLTIVTFTFQDAPGPRLGSLDMVAITKLAVRGLAVTGLGAALLLVWQSHVRNRTLTLLLPFGLFVAWAAASTLWSPLRMITAGQTFSLVSLVAVAAACAVLCRNRHDFSRIVGFLGGLLFFVACLILLLHRVPGVGPLSRENLGLMHPTNAAASSALGLLLVAAGFLVFRWRFRFSIAIPVLAVHGAVLALSLNRLAPLALIAVAVPLFLFYSPRSLMAVVVLTLSVSLAIYVTCDPGLRAAGAVADKFEVVGMRGQKSKELQKLSGREILWKKMWASHEESPWKGHGYFVTTSTGEMAVWGGKGNVSAHNALLQVLVTTGWIGLTLFLVGLIVPYRYVMRGLIRTSTDRKLLGFLVLTLAWFLLWGQANESISGPITPETVVFFVLLGCGMGVAMRRTEAWSRLCHSSASVAGPARSGA